MEGYTHVAIIQLFSGCTGNIAAILGQVEVTVVVLPVGHQRNCQIITGIKLIIKAQGVQLLGIIQMDGHILTSIERMILRNNRIGRICGILRLSCTGIGTPRDILDDTVCICVYAADKNHSNGRGRIAVCFCYNGQVHRHTNIAIIQFFGIYTFNITTILGQIKVTKAAVPIRQQGKCQFFAGSNLIIKGYRNQLIGIAQVNVQILTCTECILSRHRRNAGIHRLIRLVAAIIYGPGNIFNHTASIRILATDIEHGDGIAGITCLSCDRIQVEDQAQIAILQHTQGNTL